MGDNGSMADELRDMGVGDSADFALAHAFDRLVISVDALRNEIRADRISREATEKERSNSDRARIAAQFALSGAIIVALVGAIAGRALLAVTLPW